MRRSACMPLLGFLLISAFIFSGCAATYRPGSIHDVGFRKRAQSKSDKDVRVTVAVLSAEESKELFGVDLALKKIQPVWVKVENHDTRVYGLSSTGLDPDYFSPLEVAYVFHSGYSETSREDIDDYFQHIKFKNPIVPNAAVSGFVFTNLDEGMKVVDIDLLSGADEAKFFTFIVPVPGIKVDYHEVDFDKLYSEEEIVDLDEDELRKALEELPCCTTNEDGTQKGDPLNLVLKGVGASTRSNPRENLTGDPYFTAGYRVVLMFDRRPRSVKEFQFFDWEKGPVSYRVKRLKTDRKRDYDEQR